MGLKVTDIVHAESSEEITQNLETTTSFSLKTPGKKSAFEQIVEKYEAVVYSLAYHLTSDESASRHICFNVFGKIAEDGQQYSHEPLDSVVHKLTYDMALKVMLLKIAAHEPDTEGIEREMATRKAMLVC